MKRVAILVALAGCSDFATPSNLDRPQILAVRSSPPSLAPGESAQLDALVAGPDGVITAPLVWTLLHPIDGVVLADATLSTTPTASGEVTVLLTSEDLVAEKGIAIGQHAENPALTVSVNGDTGDRAVAARSQTLQLVASQSERVTWYATCGEIVRYRDAVTELVTADESCDGWLIAVGRDRGLGVAWRVIQLLVE